jgi:hypothetical protein
MIYNINFTPTVGALGTLIEFKESTESTWVVADDAANPTTLSTFPLDLTPGLTYNIRLSSVSSSCTPKYKIINVVAGGSGTCCPAGYTLSPDESYCYQEDTASPTIVESDYCLAISQLSSQYSSSGSYVYEPGYTIHLVGSRTFMGLQPQWREQSGQVLGPMNRDGIWVDSDCNGTKDSLTVGQSLQITHIIDLVSPQTFYIGMAGDNTFKVEINGTTVVDCNLTDPAGGEPVGANFNLWHIFPINLPAGTNYLLFSGIGDGSTNDSLAFAIYDNTKAEILAATDDSELNIIFRSSELIGDPIQIATCPAGYFLDTSEGPGSYVCRQIITTSTISC